MNTVDWIGFIGVFQILLAYLLNVMGRVTSKDLLFILFQRINNPLLTKIR
jgi:hypothetical protein